MTSWALLAAGTSGTTTAGPSTTETVLISAAVSLAVAVVTVGGSFLLERARRRIADRRWLLDRRHDAYIRFITADDALTRAMSEARARPSLTTMSPLSQLVSDLASAIFGIVLVGTDYAQWHAGVVLESELAAVDAIITGGDPSAHLAAASQGKLRLYVALRRELQPRRHWPWTSENARDSAATPTSPREPKPKPRS